jgi:hypothetical protein
MLHVLSPDGCPLGVSILAEQKITPAVAVEFTARIARETHE